MEKIDQRSTAANRTKRLNSFFSGIGGFDIAFEKNGFKTQFYCENDPFCRSVLQRHWPNVKNASNIQNLKTQEIPHADVWAAGFPCQDLSLARTPHGTRSGLKGARSGLFYEFLAHLATHKPKVVLLENVAGLLNSHKGADFKALLTSLTDLGYAVAWRVLNARYFGAPQSRPRVFICAWLGAPERAAATLFEENISPKPKNERRGFMLESKCETSGASVSQVSFCISATSGRHTGLDWARSYVTYPNSVRRLTPLECERLQGLPDNWTIPDKSYITPIRGIETNRYHAVGNAVCVPVVQWIAARISGELESSAASASMEHPKWAELCIKYLSPDAKHDNFTAEKDEWKWQSAGLAYNNVFATSSASSAPNEPVNSRFIDLIEKSPVHERYYLSTNAVQGIIRRVDKLRRNLFPPLDSTLRKILASVEKTETLQFEHVTLAETSKTSKTSKASVKS